MGAKFGNPRQGVRSSCAPSAETGLIAATKRASRVVFAAMYAWHSEYIPKNVDIAATMRYNSFNYSVTQMTLGRYLGNPGYHGRYC